MPDRKFFVLLLLAVLAAIALRSRRRRATDIGPGERDRTHVVCPSDAEAARVIVSVTSTSWGVSILLTAEGVDLARDRDGASRVVRMASDLYARLPDDQRTHDNLLWANPGITREVLAHAWAASLGITNGNPVDVVFGDYGGPGITWQAPLWNGPLGIPLDLLGRTAGRWHRPARDHQQAAQDRDQKDRA